MTQPTLGIKVLELRNKKGMTQKELAELCNVDIRTIQRIESGEVVPRMYTIKLLSNALGCEISDFNSNTESDSQELNKHLKSSYVFGIIFTLNYIFVVFHLITQSFNFSVHVFTIIVSIATCIPFFRGFYVLGKYHKNQLLAISSLLSMILLPLLNVVYLLAFSYFNFLMNYSIFAMVCICAICSGIGLFLEGAKRKSHYKINAYKTAGIITVIQSILFLSSNNDLVSVGLVMSIFCNLISIKILYKEFMDLKEGNRKYAMNTVTA